MYSEGRCESLSETIPDCYYDYSPEIEDTTELSLPGWRPLPLNASWPKALRICPKPWRYQTAETLDTDPVKAVYNTYGGGGYVAVLGYDEQTARGVLDETIGHGWLDRNTRSVIVEFAAFNFNTNLISIATFHVLSHLSIFILGNGAILRHHDVVSPLQTTVGIF